MKKIFLLVVSVFLAFACEENCEGMKVSVTNPSSFDRSAEMVEIPVGDINVGEGIVLQTGQTFVVKNEQGEVVPSQVTYDGKLIFQSGLGASQTLNYYITYGEAHEFEPRTYGRYIPERKDDYAWENDKVAFRIYGPALEPIDGPSNGIDIWYKRTDKLIVDKWYADDLSGVRSYHADSGEGLDDYKVGRTLGAGAMAPFVEGKLLLNSNYVTQTTLENGPLRTTFQVTYKDLEIANRSIPETRTFSIDAGSQLTKVVQLYTNAIDMDVAAGIVVRQGKEDFREGSNYIVYTNNESQNAGDAYVAVVSPKDFSRVIMNAYTIEDAKGRKTTHTHLLGMLRYKPNVPVVYYTGYGWSKSAFSDSDSFVEYIEHFSESLKNPLKIKY